MDGSGGCVIPALTVSQFEMKVLRLSFTLELHSKQVFQRIHCSMLYVRAEELIHHQQNLPSCYRAIGCRFFLFEHIHPPSKLAQKIFGSADNSFASRVVNPSRSTRWAVTAHSLHTLLIHLKALSGVFDAARTASRTLIFQSR